MPKLLVYETYHDILIAKTFASRHAPARKLQLQPHCPPVEDQWRFQSYLSSTEFIIQDVLEFFSIPLKLASITVHRVVCALHKTQSPAKDLSLDPWTHNNFRIAHGYAPYEIGILMLYIQNSKPLVVCICISDFVTVRLQMFHIWKQPWPQWTKERETFWRERERERGWWLTQPH